MVLVKRPRKLFPILIRYAEQNPERSLSSRGLEISECTSKTIENFWGVGREGFGNLVRHELKKAGFDDKAPHRYTLPLRF